MSDLFGRRASLILSPAQGQGIELQDFRFKFEIRAMDAETPNTAIMRIYNLSDSTVNQVRGEFSRVILNAGYEDGNYGLIFDGTIKQFHKGRESNVDSYLDVLAADGDLGYNFAFINKTLGPNCSALDQAKALAEAMNMELASGSEAFLQGGILPRGKTLFGLARSYFRDLATSQKCRWSIQKGKIVIVPLDGYLEGEVIVLTSRTGMVGIPQATDNGIMIRTLLNPLYEIGNRVQIDNASINQVQVLEQGFPQFNSLSFPASVTDDGFYRILVVEHTGDTRGQEWYSELTCIAVSGGTVKAYG